MTLWSQINNQLVAKSIGELHFEEVLAPVRDGESWRLDLQSGITYTFEGRLSAWGHLWVNADSIARMSKTQDISAGQFFIDARQETGMSEITLGTFLEEMNNTLFSDLQVLPKAFASAREMSDWDDVKIQQALSGHPKLLLNKGRMGWGSHDLHHYSPEQNGVFQLQWILVKSSGLTGSAQAGFTHAHVVDQSFQGADRETLLTQLKSYDLGQFQLMPVHPWQWQNVIELQFASEIQNGNIIPLGFMGDSYTAQVSLRTLANVDRPEKADLKLPLSILNTSCVRGLPHRYLSFTPELSDVLTKLCQADAQLQKVSIMGELAAWGYQHPLFHQVKGAPYRYHEQLGAVWRESGASKLQSQEQTILTAALFHRDEDGQTMLAAYALKAGLAVEEWLKLYAQNVIIPLYHLQLAYGIGVVAHGQNVVLRLKNGAPVGMFLKDFHGDLRLSSAHLTGHQKHFPTLLDKLTHLPPEHLIHDLITGHFITVLRFIAGALEDSKALTEKKFYQVLAQEILQYQQKNPALINDKTNVLAPSFPRVLVNKVRFKIGYGDSAERPLPLLGEDLANPLFRELQK